MARKKVKIAWIANEAARRVALKKRRNGILKKVSELSTLCGIQACAIIYTPKEPRPEVWPAQPDAIRVLARFRNMPEMEQFKKKMNQEGFLCQRNMKIQEQLRKQERENKELEVSLFMNQVLAGRSLHDVGVENVTSLCWMVEMKAKAVQERIEIVKVKMALEAPPKENKPLETAMEGLRRQEWFMEAMNPYYSEHMVCGIEEMVLPFVGNNYSWSDPYFPFN